MSLFDSLFEASEANVDFGALGRVNRSPRAGRRTYIPARSSPPPPPDSPYLDLSKLEWLLTPAPPCPSIKEFLDKGLWEQYPLVEPNWLASHFRPENYIVRYESFVEYGQMGTRQQRLLTDAVATHFLNRTLRTHPEAALRKENILFTRDQRAVVHMQRLERGVAEIVGDEFVYRTPHGKIERARLDFLPWYYYVGLIRRQRIVYSYEAYYWHPQGQNPHVWLVHALADQPDVVERYAKFWRLLTDNPKRGEAFDGEEPDFGFRRTRIKPQRIPDFIKALDPDIE